MTLRSIGSTLLALLVVACGDGSVTVPAFIGAATCGSCHQDQYDRWRASQHAQAMQQATDRTVLGDFSDVQFAAEGVEATFTRRDGQFIVRMAGPDGTPVDHVVQFTFGVSPLQQYLVSFPGGRLQPLSIAWDTRSRSEGGQRWFSLDPEPGLKHGDAMHWAGRTLNWNFMCADCHSTGVRKGYVAEADTFATTFVEINVACEACHGPGSSHAKWADAPRLLRRLTWKDNGLVAQLTDRKGASWSIDSVTGNARRNVPRSSTREVDVCAQCHARRTHIADGYVAGAPLLDHYDPSLLFEDLYHADGQQRDEVYNHGSFLQSRMFALGVTCSDCHDPHGGKVRRPGNGVCAQCHRAVKFDATAHHGHANGSAGAQCATCHMPVATYLEIDQRHDHSMRVPRPDRTGTIGTPHVCGQCHLDRDARWASDAISRWSGKPPAGFQRFAEAFATDDSLWPGAADSLVETAFDAAAPAIVRASALGRLAEHPYTIAAEDLQEAARDTSVLVRRGVVMAARSLLPSQRLPILVPLLRDPLRAIRQEAAWALARVADSLQGADRAAFERAADEFVASQRYNDDRAEHRVTLGTYFFDRGDRAAAAREYEAVVGMYPHFMQAYLNLAGIQSLEGREAVAESTLRLAVSRIPDEPAVYHALGTSIARSGRVAQAVPWMERAARLSGHHPEYSYPLAVVLMELGRRADALRTLEVTRRKFPYDRNVLLALGTWLREDGERERALVHARTLVSAFPRDLQANALLRSLESPVRRQ
jgi:predicted CXXCH cytochrome family protein